MKKSIVVILICFIVLSCLNLVSASLLHVPVEYPRITFDSGGMMFYNSSTGLLNITAKAFLFMENASSFPLAVYNGSLKMNFAYNGIITSSVFGDDFVLRGNIDYDGNLGSGYEFNGTLLTGEIREFGWIDSGVTDQYDLIFTPTGGSLMTYFNGKSIGMLMNSLNSNFNGNFSRNFGGTAEGALGPYCKDGDTCDKFGFCEQFAGISCYKADYLDNEKSTYPCDCRIIYIQEGLLRVPRCVPNKPESQACIN